LARLRHLAVFIPGIGGSVLAGADGSGGYALTTDGLARTLASPNRLDLEQHPDLAPTGLVHDLAILPPLLTLPGYGRFYQRLRTTFPAAAIDVYRGPDQVCPDTDVLMFPYDFRRSVAETSLRLAEAVGALPDRPVIVVAHSLGGLVARHWIAVGEGGRRCVALLTLGTPHRGAPKALDWLVNGAGMGLVRDPRMTRVIRGWPSVYELLPQYEAVWEASAGSPLELTQLPPSLLAGRPRLAGYADQFEQMAAAARSVHDEIRTRACFISR
jgi:pimeloyl-ACP methyl ester carboxylesterase